jgi:hypothetical protein
MRHGGGSTGGNAKRGAPSGAAPPASFDPRGFGGFGYFLGDPSPDKRSSWGDDLDTAQAVLAALYTALPQDALADNTNIPAGYTYLLQLVAHDLVQSTEPLWLAAEIGIPVANARTASLRLDTLYGGGPTICPVAFAPGTGGATPDYSTQLQLGRVSDAAALGLTGQCPFRDLARVTMVTPRAGGAPAGAAPAPGPTANFDNATQLYVADVRSGEGAVLSQLVVLFAILHNAIAGRLGARGLAASAQFAFARTAVLRIYHAVIRNDLLKRLLHAEIYARLSARPASSADWLWRGSAIPYEFSHGAFRIGHGMTRPFYDLNGQPNQPLPLSDLLQTGFFGNPLPSNWILAWSKFFELGGTPNYAKKFAATQFLALNADNVLQVVAPGAPSRISTRDWLSAIAARMWRTDALVDAVAAHYPGLRFLRSADIETWLGKRIEQQENIQLSAVLRGHLQHLAADLPLPLHVLLEAQLDPAAQGSRAGALASVIIGEVVFRLLAEAAAGQASLPTQAAQAALGADDWAQIDTVKDMPALVRLAEDWGGLAQCRTLPFIALPTA